MNDHVLSQAPESGPPISRGRLATVLWIVVECMLFAGILSAFVITRMTNRDWPPPYTYKGTFTQPPKVDLMPAVINAGVLISAFVVALLAQKAARRRETLRCRLRLTTVMLLGIAFVGIVVWELVSEAGRGVTVRSGVYGAYWVVLTLAHALHVLAGVVWLFILLNVRVAVPFGMIDKDRVEHLGLYWGFVTVLWIVLLGLLHFL